jgi:flagellar assembly protein FliH
MSNLLGRDGLEGIASLGTFALGASDPIFTPWGRLEFGNEAEEEDHDPAPPDLIAEAYDRGWHEGSSFVEGEVAAERSAFVALAAALESLRPEPAQALAAVLGATVERLVRQIVGEAAVDPDLLTKRAAAAAAFVTEEMAPARMRLNPDDLPLLSGAGLALELVADPELARGTILIETALGWIEDGPSVRLDRLRAALDGLGID